MNEMTRLSSLLSQGLKPNSEARLEGFNTNSKGGYDFQEVQNYVEQKRENERLLEGVQMADLSGDGEITLEELRAMRNKIIVEQFMNSEKDGGLVKDSDQNTFFGNSEKPNGERSDIFNPGDIDGDGEISLEELEALRRR
jgi:Ca2+-binding EF-hand superfamily protein